MSKKFQIICADPPYSFYDKLQQSDVARGAAANYNTMTISQIKQVPVKDIADPNGTLLALWVPSSLLQEGLDVMKEWGFTHKQTYVWVKTKKIPFISIIKNVLNTIESAVKSYGFSKKHWKNYFSSAIDKFSFNEMLAFGMGRLFRQSHELCLIGINNKNLYKLLNNKSQRSVSFGENLRHSAKPEHLQNSLGLMFPLANKLELFARRHKVGWTCLGNEICNGEDINVSLSKLM